MSAKILMVFALLLSFGYLGVFALPNCTAYGTLHKSACASFTKSVSCNNGFSTALSCGQKTCNWAGGCAAGAQSCQWGTKSPTSSCLNLGKNPACPNFCQEVGTQCNPCHLQPSCTQLKAGNCYIPEFAGIEFGEMEIPTGIIALLAAIGLPLFLFKKKRAG